MQPFDYYHPKDFEETFNFLSSNEKIILPLAGGTDFIPTYRDGAWKADAVVDIKDLPGMRDIRETPEGLFIGAAVKMNELTISPLVKTYAAVLADAAATVGHDQVRNRATIGGNLCTASPAADTPPALLVLDAKVVIRSKTGERKVPVNEFFTWVRKTVLQKGELVTGVIIPKPEKGTVGNFQKLSRRKGSDLSVVSVAVLAVPKVGGYTWRIGMGSVAPTPIRALEAEKVLSGGHTEEAVQKAAKATLESAKPISDIRSSEKYRRMMVFNMSQKAIQAVVQKLG